MTSGGPVPASSLFGASSTFNQGPAGRHFGGSESQYLNATHGTAGSGSVNDFERVFGSVGGVYELNKKRPISNFYTTLHEVYRNQTIPLLTTILDNVLAVNACNPILAIVSPYLRTLKQTATYEMLAMNIYPAQPTLNGVSERTNTYIRHAFAVSTRQYGIQAMMPVDILQTPYEQIFRRNITMLMMGLSLAYTFIQVVLVYFVMHATIGSYVANFGYNFQAGTCNMANVDATDRRYIGVGTNGPDDFLRALDLHVRTLTHPAGRDRTFILTTPDVGTYLSTQIRPEQIKNLETYIGYVTRPELDGPIISAKKNFRIPPNQQAWALPGAGSTILLPVPTLPISTRVNLPHLLRQLTSTPQFYYQPQRTKMATDTDVDRNLLGIYDLHADDYTKLRPSVIMARSGVWDMQTGHFSHAYGQALLKASKPSVVDQLEEVRRRTQSEEDVLVMKNFKGSLPLTTFDTDDQAHRLCTEFHDISEDTHPVSHSIRGGNDLMRNYPEDIKNLKKLMDMMKPLLDTPPTAGYIKLLHEANAAGINGAERTTWGTDHSTYSKCQFDLGTLVMPAALADPDSETNGTLTRGKTYYDMIGVGLAHSPDAIRQLANVDIGTSAPALERVNKMIQTLDNFEDVNHNKVITRSSVFRRCPYWDQSQSSVTAVSSNLRGAIPAFMKRGAVDPELRKVFDIWTYDHLMTRLAFNASGGKTTVAGLPDFTARVTLIQMIGAEAYQPRNFGRIDYMLFKGVDLKIPSDLKAIWNSREAVEFAYPVTKMTKSEETLLKTLCSLATNLAILCVVKGKDDAPRPHELVSKHVSFKNAVDWLKKGHLPSSMTVSTGDSKDTTLLELFSGHADLKYVNEIDRLSGQFILTEYVRLPFVLSLVGWKRYISTNKLKDNDGIFPGNWRTGYATAIETVQDFDAVFINQLAAINTHNADQHAAALEEQGKAKHPTLDYEEPSADNTNVSGGGLFSDNSAPGGRSIKRSLKIIHGISAIVPVQQAGVYQSKQMSTGSQRRIKVILNKFGETSADEAILYAIYLYLFMPTDLFTMGTLADANIWVPVDGAVLRVIVCEASTALILSDGCGQMILNPPSVAQRSDSISNNSTMKATIHIGVRPTLLGSMTAIRGAFMHQNLYGLTTKFIDDPKQMLTIDRQGGTMSTACLFAMIVAPTDDLGDCFSWSGNLPDNNAMTLSRLDGSTPCRHMPEVFDLFYRSFYQKITRHTKGLSDRRMALIKSYYTPQGNLVHGDNDANLRSIAESQLIDDLWTRGPCATYERGKLKTISGIGPFSAIHHQAKGAATCWRGNVHYFPQADPRQIGMANN